MSFPGWRLAALAALLIGQSALAQSANAQAYFGPNTAAAQGAPEWQQVYPPSPPQTASQSLPATQSFAQPCPLAPPAANFVAPLAGYPSEPIQPITAAGQYPLPQPAWNQPVQFPQVTPLPPTAPETLPPPPAAANPGAAGPIDGTWRDDGQFVIIDVNGQQIRLAKSAMGQQPPAAPAAPQVATGSVHGRLLQRGQPLVNCNVVLVPMHKDGRADDEGLRQPLNTVTNPDGSYDFVNVPIGAYKLTWLPAGAEQWIRRIEMKPDVFVRDGQDDTVKEIRMATRTVN